MSQILTLKIDVMKLDREAFYKGEKGTYATISVFVNDDKDDYGNYGRVTQDLGKERREAGERGPIIGNVTRIFNQNGSGQVSQSRQPAAQSSSARLPTNNFRNDDSDSIPF